MAAETLMKCSALLIITCLFSLVSPFLFMSINIIVDYKAVIYNQM